MSEPVRQWLTLECPPLAWALPVEQIERVLPLAAWAPLPCKIPRVRGLLNLYGEAIPVLDLRGAHEEAPPHPDHRLVVVNGRHRLALWVDSIGELFSCAPQDIAPFPGAAVPWLGTLSRSGRILLLQEPDRLLDATELAELERALAALDPEVAA